jgi:hypothetical protein
LISNGLVLFADTVISSVFAAVVSSVFVTLIDSFVTVVISAVTTVDAVVSSFLIVVFGERLFGLGFSGLVDRFEVIVP